MLLSLRSNLGLRASNRSLRAFNIRAALSRSKTSTRQQGDDDPWLTFLKLRAHAFSIPASALLEGSGMDADLIQDSDSDSPNKTTDCKTCVVDFAVDDPSGSERAPIVSLVCHFTGDASLYTSAGGGIIGGIAHDRVVAAALSLVETAQEAADSPLLTPEPEASASSPPPPPSQPQTVAYHAVRFDGTVLSCEEPSPESPSFDVKRHAHNLFRHYNNVLTQFRIIQEEKENGNNKQN